MAIVVETRDKRGDKEKNDKKKKIWEKMMSKLSYEDIFEYRWQPSSLVFKDSVLALKELNKNTGLW